MAEEVIKAGEAFYLNVFRFDPDEDREPRFDRFEVPYDDGMTVLSALLWVLDYADGSLALRYSCREAICGSCAMVINGWFHLACKTQVKDMIRQAGSRDVTVRPLPNQPIIKDLVVDMTGFFEKYRAVMPYLVNDNPPEKEFRQSPEERRAFDAATICILCGACTASCPTAWTNDKYLGPAALLKAYRFAADSRDEAVEARLAVVADEEGVYRCHTIFSCTEACPKDIPITEAIQALKREATQRILLGKRRKTIAAAKG